MLVYIDELEEWFDSAEDPIMLHLSPQDKRRIENMPDQHERYLSYPRGTSRVRVNSLLQIPPPVSMGGGGLDDLNIDGIAQIPDND